MRCRFKLPTKGRYPDSIDPEFSPLWAKERSDEEYNKLVTAWRNQNPFEFDE